MKKAEIIKPKTNHKEKGETLIEQENLFQKTLQLPALWKENRNCNQPRYTLWHASLD
jgi:hypothetical protein